jgi:leucyl/phenylalanyl-tRNA---protein transferase
MASIHWLNPASLAFPPLEAALDEPNGLLAAGGDLRSERLLSAYRHGIFPWYEDPQPILWWAPDPRAVLFPERLHISRSLRKRLRRGDFQVTMDRRFEAVIQGCARRGLDTWITPDMAEAYTRLHREGWAHSVEVWQQERLVGGLYGVAIGRMFYAESMFSHATDASKVAMVYLCGQLQRWQFGLIDCQVGSGHLYRMGAQDMPRQQFAAALAKLTALEADVGPHWRLDWQYGD